MEASSRWRRRILGIPAVVWAVAIPLTALAVVGYLVTLNTSGTVSTGQPIDVTYAAGGGAVSGWSEPALPGSGLNCNGTRVSGTQITFDINNAVPGDSCRYEIQVSNAAGMSTAYFQGFKLTGPALGPLNVTNIGCGEQIAAGTTQTVEFRLTLTASYTPGATVTFNGTDSGMDFAVQSLYDQTACENA